MLPDRVSNPGPLTYESGALPIALRGPAAYTAKNIRRFYGIITGNQLPVHFPLFFTGACKHFQESRLVR